MKTSSLLALLLLLVHPLAAQQNGNGRSYNSSQGFLASVTSVVATQGGTTSTVNYQYAVVASDGIHNSVYALSNSILNGSTFGSQSNSITCTGPSGATTYTWYRLSPVVSNQFGKFATSSSCSLTDSGAAGDNTTPWSMSTVGISLSSFQNATYMDGCNVYSVNPKYPCTAAGVQRCLADAHGWAGVTGVCFLVPTAQIPGSTLGAIFGSSNTVSLPSYTSLVCLGAPYSCQYDSQVVSTTPTLASITGNGTTTSVVLNSPGYQLRPGQQGVFTGITGVTTWNGVPFFVATATDATHFTFNSSVNGTGTASTGSMTIGSVAFDFPSGTVEASLVNVGVELDNTDSYGIAFSFEGTNANPTANNRILGASCYGNPTYGFPPGMTCLSIQSIGANSNRDNQVDRLQVLGYVTVPMVVETQYNSGNDLANTFTNFNIGITPGGISSGWGATSNCSAECPAITAKSTLDIYENMNLHNNVTGGNFTGIKFISGGRTNYVTLFCDMTTSNNCTHDLGGANEWHVFYTSANTNLGTLVTNSIYGVCDFTNVTCNTYQSQNIAATYSTFTKCAAVGSAASPSIATCGAAASGFFSCATNASGATCSVSTSAVDANSVILVQEADTAAAGTALGVTCNTSTNVLPASRLLASWTNGSFTVNVGTITTNPACFSYLVFN